MFEDFTSVQLIRNKGLEMIQDNLKDCKGLCSTRNLKTNLFFFFRNIKQTRIGIVLFVIFINYRSDGTSFVF